MELQYLCRDFFDPKESIHAGFYVQNRNMHMHSHEFWEISYIYEGNGLHYRTNEKTIPITAESLTLISPDYAHCITSPPPQNGCWVRALNVLVKKEKMEQLLEKLLAFHEYDDYVLRNFFAQSPPFCIQFKTDSPNIYNLLMVITHEYNHPAPGSEWIIETSLLNLLMLMIRQYEASLSSSNSTAVKNEIIRTLTKYIRFNYSNHLSLEFLSAYVHLSPEYLSRYFKKKTGKNLSTYITEIRLENAKYFLRTSQISIGDIAAHCGFKSISNFQKAFKKHVGMSAGQYREKEQP